MGFDSEDDLDHNPSPRESRRYRSQVNIAEFEDSIDFPCMSDTFFGELCYDKVEFPESGPSKVGVSAQRKCFSNGTKPTPTSTHNDCSLVKLGKVLTCISNKASKNDSYVYEPTVDESVKSISAGKVQASFPTRGSSVLLPHLRKALTQEEPTYSKHNKASARGFRQRTSKWKSRASVKEEVTISADSSKRIHRFGKREWYALTPGEEDTEPSETSFPQVPPLSDSEEGGGKCLRARFGNSSGIQKEQVFTGYPDDPESSSGLIFLEKKFAKRTSKTSVDMSSQHDDYFQPTSPRKLRNRHPEEDNTTDDVWYPWREQMSDYEDETRTKQLESTRNSSDSLHNAMQKYSQNPETRIIKYMQTQKTDSDAKKKSKSPFSEYSFVTEKSTAPYFHQTPQAKISQATNGLQAYNAELAKCDDGWSPGPFAWENCDVFESSRPEAREHFKAWLFNDKHIRPPSNSTLNTRSSHFTSGIWHVNSFSLMQPFEYEDTYIDLCDDLTASNRDDTSNKAVLRLFAKEEKIKRMKIMRQEWEREQARIQANRNPNAPDKDIYLRPARNADLQQITDIYNAYVSFTVSTPERDSQPSDIKHWSDRMKATEEAMLPFIVAIDDSGRFTRRSERVLGFGLIEPYGGNSSIFRLTGDVKIFVERTQQKQGIGKSILDVLISSVDCQYSPKKGAPFNIEDNEKSYRFGGRQTVSMLTCSILYCTATISYAKEITDWLATKWKFIAVGDFPRIGRKFDQWINVVHMLRECDQSINPLDSPVQLPDH